MQTLWVLDYLNDLEADFRVLYRVDDFAELSGPQFLAFAYRASAYRGVMAARVAQQDDNQPTTTRQGSEAKEVAPTRAAISRDPGLSSVVSWGDA